MLNVLIADDEILAREAIKMLLSSQADVLSISEAEDGKKAKGNIAQFKPNVVFLDIQMPGLSGIEVAREIPSDCVVIFITAHNEYAVSAFETHAVDYLLKPFEDERFYEALDRARRVIREAQQTVSSGLPDSLKELVEPKSNNYIDRLIVRDPGRIRLIDVEQIVFITGAGNYAEVHLKDGSQILHRETLTALEAQLDPSKFLRIHRSSIVRRSFISELQPTDKGDYIVKLESGDELMLSRRNRDKLNEIMH